MPKLSIEKTSPCKNLCSIRYQGISWDRSRQPKANTHIYSQYKICLPDIQWQCFSSEATSSERAKVLVEKFIIRI